MTLSAKREGFESLEEKECTEGVERCSEVAEDFDTKLYGERYRTEGLGEFEPMVTLGWFGEGWEAPGLRPVELPGVDDDAGNCGSVSSDPLCCRMDNYISAERNRLGEVTYGE